MTFRLAHDCRSKLCKLLEAEFIYLIKDHIHSSGAIPIEKQVSLMSTTGVDITLKDTAPAAMLNVKSYLQRDRKILYEDFHAKYWPRFPQSTAKGLGSSLLLGHAFVNILFKTP